MLLLETVERPLLPLLVPGQLFVLPGVHLLLAPRKLLLPLKNQLLLAPLVLGARQLTQEPTLSTATEDSVGHFVHAHVKAVVDVRATQMDLERLHVDVRFLLRDLLVVPALDAECL